MEIPEYFVHMAANNRKKERLISGGFYDLATACQSVYVNY